MELAHLPKKTATRTYKHFKVESLPVQNTAKKKTEFFYIGNETEKVDLLIDVFDAGYASDNIEHAISILKRIAGNEVPDVIVINGRCNPKGIQELHSYLSTAVAYIGIPLVVDAADITDHELELWRKVPFIDEIIFLNREQGKKLVAKVDFLQKVKRLKDQQLQTDNIQKPSSYSLNVTGISKRAFDILVSSTLILALSPVFLLLAILIKLESKGPIFYIAKRAGKGYKVFNFYKFRTMVADADKKVDQLSHLNQYQDANQTGPVFFKISNDPRITRLGALLRNSSLDELPQLFNVLLGDMSLVGNRPLPLYEAATLTTDAHAARFMAPAGITGLWQIKKRGDSNMSVAERIDLDIAYAEKFSFMYDLWIIANTPSALLQKDNV